MFKRSCWSQLKRTTYHTHREDGLKQFTTKFTLNFVTKHRWFFSSNGNSIYLPWKFCDRFLNCIVVFLFELYLECEKTIRFYYRCKREVYIFNTFVLCSKIAIAANNRNIITKEFDQLSQYFSLWVFLWEKSNASWNRLVRLNSFSIHLSGHHIKTKLLQLYIGVLHFASCFYIFFSFLVFAWTFAARRSRRIVQQKQKSCNKRSHVQNHKDTIS